LVNWLHTGPQYDMNSDDARIELYKYLANYINDELNLITPGWKIDFDPINYLIRVDANTEVIIWDHSNKNDRFLIRVSGVNNKFSIGPCTVTGSRSVPIDFSARDTLVTTLMEIMEEARKDPIPLEEAGVLKK